MTNHFQPEVMKVRILRPMVVGPRVAEAGTIHVINVEEAQYLIRWGLAEVVEEESEVN